MKIQTSKRGLLAAYRVRGFRARARIDSYEGPSRVFVITLERRQKNGVRPVQHATPQLL
jgi:hypothetical protein